MGLSAILLLSSALAAATPAEIVPDEILVLAPAGRPGSAGEADDPVQAAIVAGRWTPPKAGEIVATPGGPSRAWQAIKPDRDGTFRHPALRGGYAFASIHSDGDAVMILEAAGHAMAYTGGEPRVGDPYSHGYVRVPVALKAGENPLLFAAGRGSLRFKLTRPRAEAQIDPGDPTLPDLIVGREAKEWAAVVVVNASPRSLEGASLRAEIDGVAIVTSLPTIPPLGVRKVPFLLESPAASNQGKRDLKLALMLKEHEGPIDSTTLALEVVPADRAQRRTFVSAIDGSVQYFGLVPAAPGDDGQKPGLILTLHGASVEGIGQARVYKPKAWAHVVAPTNRRPYGFDWEEWGRLDAIEVLDLADEGARSPIPRRIYLTGHSMGGHGTWHLGVTFPDRFAAIAPSAGWVSLSTYGGRGRPDGPTDPVAALVARAKLAQRHAGPGPQPRPEGRLHPPRRQGRQRPGRSGPDDAQGPGRVPPRLRLLRTARRRALVGRRVLRLAPAARLPRPPRAPRRRRRPADRLRDRERRRLGAVHWAIVEAQIKPFERSEIHLDADPSARTISRDDRERRPARARPRAAQGRRAVHRHARRPDDPGASMGRRSGSRVKAATGSGRPPVAALKGPERSGPFRDAFRNRVQLVYGTRGTAEENAWALARARFDAETFWYRGNGSIDVVPDTAFDPRSEPDRNVVLYGHAGSNAAWPALLGDGPVQVRAGSIGLGGKSIEGDGLACLFIRPRAGSDRAVVGVVSGTGIAGMRRSDRLPYLSTRGAIPTSWSSTTTGRSRPASSASIGASSRANSPGAASREPAADRGHGIEVADDTRAARWEPHRARRVRDGRSTEIP